MVSPDSQSLTKAQRNIIQDHSKRGLKPEGGFGIDENGNVLALFNSGTVIIK